MSPDLVPVVDGDQAAGGQAVPQHRGLLPDGQLAAAPELGGHPSQISNRNAGEFIEEWSGVREDGNESGTRRGGTSVFQGIAASTPEIWSAACALRMGHRG